MADQRLERTISAPRAMIDWTDRYLASLTELDRYHDLVDAVLALSAHRRSELNPDLAHARLESLAHRVRCQVPHLASRHRTSGPRAVDGVLAHLHEALFEELGLGRHPDVMPHPDAMDLDLVLQGVPGLPVSCGLAYCAVAERVGLDVFGIDLPGHFLVAVRDMSNRRITVLDPANGGRLVDGDDFRGLTRDVEGKADPRQFLSPALPAVWLRRWLRDLSLASARSGEVHLLDSWARLSTETEEILGA
jgi:regulator of sirC expression with transglutaminase-like and TPR domain